jgi:hypothetical protein
VGPASIPKDDITYYDNKHLDPHIVMGTLIGHMVDAYPSGNCISSLETEWNIGLTSLLFFIIYLFTLIEYHAFRDLIGTRQIDLVICDHFVDSCIEAARFHGKPFVITSTLAIAPGIIFVSNEIMKYWDFGLTLFFFFFLSKKKNIRCQG